MMTINPVLPSPEGGDVPPHVLRWRERQEQELRELSHASTRGVSPGQRVASDSRTLENGGDSSTACQSNALEHQTEATGQQLLVQCPMGSNVGALVNVDGNGKMTTVQMPAGVGLSRSFGLGVAGIAEAVSAPASSAPQSTQDVNRDSHEPQNVGSTTIARNIAQDRKSTDMFWGILFLVAVAVQYGLGFYEIGNALRQVRSKWASLDTVQSAGGCSIWNEGETAIINGISHYIVYSLEGPTEEQTPALPAWDEFQSTGTCGTGDLTAWSSSDTFSCSPPDNHGWYKASSYSAVTYDVCPPPPPPPVAATTATTEGGATCEFTNDGECDEPEGPDCPDCTGACAAGTDSADCGGSGRRRVQTRSRRSRSQEPAPPPPAINYAVLATNYSSSSGVMVFESRNKGEEYKWEKFTWEEANSLCDDAGARLCSAEELVNGLGGGCTVAESLVWAADECDGGHVAVSASSMGGTLAAIDGLDMQCAATCEDMNRAVKCCADTTAAKQAESMQVFEAKDVAKTDDDAKTLKHKTLQEKKQNESDDDGFAGVDLTAGVLGVLLNIVFLFCIGLGYIYSMRENPKFMIVCANASFPVILFGVGSFFMWMRLLMVAVILWIATAVCLYVLRSLRTQLAAATKLLGMGSKALLDNSSIILVKGLLIVLQLVVTLPIMIFLVVAHFQTSEWSVFYQEPGNPDCLDVCTFDYGASASRYLHMFMLIWIGVLFNFIMVHTTAGATAMWYFHRDDTAYNMPSRPALTTLKWSLSSGFGTLAMAALIISPIVALKWVDVKMKYLRHKYAATEPCGYALIKIAAHFTQKLAKKADVITELSVIAVAITNDNFWSSCKSSKDVLYRCYKEHTMDYIVRLTTTTLRVFAMAVALVTFVFWWFYMLEAVLPDSTWDPFYYMVLVLAAVIVIIAYLTLHAAVGSAVLATINSLYVCYLIDRDGEHAPTENTAKIHQAFEEVVGVGTVARKAQALLNFGESHLLHVPVHT